MGPIELADTVGLDVAPTSAKILEHWRPRATLRSASWSQPASSARRRARASTSGTTASPRSASEAIYDQAELERLGRELVEPMIDEAERALADEVVENADLVDAGVIFGTGFAPFRGGPLHYRKAEKAAAAATAAAA